MEGPIATPTPIPTRTVFRKLTGNCTSSTSRCLFGPPDITEAKTLVKEVELKNALKFGKHFNFDIVNGEPFPFSTKAEAEQQNLSSQKKITEEAENDSYFWNEKYSPDHLEISNRNAVNRQITWSLFIVPIFLSSNQENTCNVPSSPKISTESPNLNFTTASVTEKSPNSSTETIPHTENIYPETNNNNITSSEISKFSSKSKTVSKSNKTKTLSCKNQQSPEKSKTKAPTAKYLNRLVRHAVTMKKSRKANITDYLKVRRTKAGKRQHGKKQKLRDLY